MDYSLIYKVQLVSHSPISVDGYEVEFDQHKIQFHAIVVDLIITIDVISARDKEFLAFHPLEQ